MSVSTEIAAALLEAEGIASSTFTLSSTSYACSASSFEKGKTLESGGFEVSYNLVLTVRKSLFSGTYPAEGQTLSHKSKNFRIERVVEDPTSTFLRLFCSSTTTGGKPK